MVETVEVDNRGNLVVRASFRSAALCQRIPDRRLWDAKHKVWRAAPSRVNLEYLRSVFPRAEWSPEARDVEARERLGAAAPQLAATDDYPFVDPPPYAHQREAFARSRRAPAFALHMEQRTGKTRVMIDTACDWWLRGHLDLVLVLCPNTVKSVWAEEIPRWSPRTVPYRVFEYTPGRRQVIQDDLRTAFGGLTWVLVNAEALSTENGAVWVKGITEEVRCACFVDEATRFKRHSARRTKTLLKARGRFCLRRTGTGTPVTQGPLDVFAPFYFLDPAILGYHSFYGFRNDHAIMGGYQGKNIIGYVNLDRLTEKMAPFTFRCLRRDCFDMPEKVHLPPLAVDMTPEQARLYRSMKDDMLAGFDGSEEITTTIILTQILRLQQIAGGFLPQPPVLETLPDGRVRSSKSSAVPIPGPNPKLEALLDRLEDEPGKVVVWARFVEEIELIAAALAARFGPEAVVTFYGAVDTDQRLVNRTRFQDPNDPCRYLVGNAATGGLGIPLHAADLMVYFSNSHVLEDRLQSEDRGEAATRVKGLGVLDLVARGTEDLKIRAALREKKSLADVVNRDKVKGWLLDD